CLGGGLADLLGLRLVVPQEPHDGIDVPHGMVFCQPLGGMQLLLIVSESKPVQVPLLANPVLRCKPNSEEDNDAYGGSQESDLLTFALHLTHRTPEEKQYEELSERDWL